MSARHASGLQPLLLAWYRRSHRPLPWRRTDDPYRIWVSEVMLQQTTVKTVMPYYESFLERFPTVSALAAAAEEDVLAAWSGLGYYHRARNLHRGAKHVAQHGGRFPRTLEGALGVPGVGLYTASAVLSIAYGVALPVVDGNVRRVFARLFALRGASWRKEGRYYNRAEELLDTEAPGDWNQALMELGATVCTPRKPACPVCPVRAQCRALAEGLTERLPEAKARHAITFRRIRVEGYGARLKRKPPDDPDRYLWADPRSVGSLPVSSLTKKLLAGLGRPQLPLPLGAP